MKKILRITRNAVLILIVFSICIVIFLFAWYGVLDKRLSRAENSPGPLAEMTEPDEAETGNVTALNLLPVPQMVKLTTGSYSIPPVMSYTVTDSLKDNAGRFLERIPGVKAAYVAVKGNISFRFRPGIPQQGYNLEIMPSGIRVEYSSRQGLWYAVVTLKVLCRNYRGKIPCAVIEDYPDMNVRGMMLDVSRNKIPTRETLLKIAGMLADLKYNHFELYIEGFSFAYPSFRDLWEQTETPVTGEEIKELDSFCKDNFIDLVPNQNMFGHMTAWLETDRFKHLAELPEGYKIFGLINMKGTLNPGDPGSLELVTKMTDDLLPNFTSASFNVNLDEPFELGKGKSKKECKERGVGEVYMDYVMQIHHLITARNRKMLMWGDIVLKHPETISRIPGDVTLLDWGYESAYSFDKHASELQAAGIRFLLCPGTSSWSSFVGRTDNMIGNIRNAATSGVRYGAAGMLLTDWGDMGHWQYLPVSYAGYATGSTLSWNSRDFSYGHLAGFLSSYMFSDEAGIMGRLALDAGRYPVFEEKKGVSMTWTMMSLQIGLRDRILEECIYDKMTKGISEMMKEISPEFVSGFIEQASQRNTFNFKGMYSLIDSAEFLLQQVKMTGDEGPLVIDEYRNAFRLLRLGVDKQYFVRFRSDLPPGGQKEFLYSMKKNCTRYLDENRRLWLARNKPGGCEISVKVLNTLMQDIDKQLALLDKSSFSRSVNRFIGKVTTAAAVLYIKSS